MAPKVAGDAWCMLMPKPVHEKGARMTRRLYPTSHLHEWGLQISNQRCPRCHVHRFRIQVTREEYHRLTSGSVDSMFAVGKCERCCHKENYRISPDGTFVQLI